MVLNMSEEDINDPESRELTFAANESLKLQAVTAPKVLLGHQVTLLSSELLFLARCVIGICCTLKNSGS